MEDRIIRKLTLMLVGTLAIASVCRAQLQLAGDWRGTLNAGGTELHLILHITMTADGSLRATLDSVDQGAHGIPVSSITLKDSRLSLTVSAVHGSYEGALNNDATEITGTWSQGQSYDLAFKRASVQGNTSRSMPSTKAGSDGLTGVYDVFLLQQPTRGVARLEIKASSDDINVQGIGQNWIGQGKANGTNGFYNWRFANGASGRTEFTINADGSLRGHVIGSGVDWWFLARKRDVSYPTGPLQSSQKVPEAQAQSPQQQDASYLISDSVRNVFKAARAAEAAERAHNDTEAVRLWREVDAAPEFDIAFAGLSLSGPNMSSVKGPDGRPNGGMTRNPRFFAEGYSQALGEARMHIGYDYEVGRGLPQDYAEAARWYQRSIDTKVMPETPTFMGGGSSEMRLAVLYAYGLGVPEDRKKAKELSGKYATSDANMALLTKLLNNNALPKAYNKDTFWQEANAVAGRLNGANAVAGTLNGAEREKKEAVEPTTEIVLNPGVPGRPFPVKAGGVTNLHEMLRGKPGESWGSFALIYDYAKSTMLTDGCVGFVSDAPNLRFIYKEALLPSIRVVLATDSDPPFTLVVRAPNGRYYCSQMDHRPTLLSIVVIYFVAPPTGQYDVWTGLGRPGEVHDAQIALIGADTKEQRR